MIAFGPIPSRRLGQSLGINNIPPKSCSYDCVYCQVGPTADVEIKRREFFEPEEIVNAVQQKLEESVAANARIDYLSFVPDGEPTLDIHLGETIDLLKTFKIKIAVFTNASLLWREDVRKELGKADCVSIKMDAAHVDSWQKINRPNNMLSLETIFDGISTFSKEFQGELISETMLIQGVNDNEANLRATAEFLKRVNPSIAYLAIPTRPPAESWVQSPDEQTLNKAYQIFDEQLNEVELLTGFSSETFSATGDTVQSILDITSVHPMRESEVLSYLQKGGIVKEQLNILITDEKLVRVVHEGQPFYIRKYSSNKREKVELDE